MSTTRSVTVHPNFPKRAKHALASIAQMTVEYSTCCVQQVEGAWTGCVLSAPAAIRITDDANTFSRKLAPIARVEDAAALTPAISTAGQYDRDIEAAEHAASSSFTWQTIAGLIASAMGCFIFGLYLRGWLCQRKALASEPPQDMIA
jgi:hypothetical protein